MAIFLQSRGYSPNYEYCWQPEVLPYLSVISSLIQSESPSVVLARFDKKLILLATGLDSPEKKDFRDRPIRHSIAWALDDNSDNEIQIRAITINALEGLLAHQVDKHIQFGGENGFEVSISGIEEMGRSFLNEIINTTFLPSEELRYQKIGKNSQNLRKQLVSNLQQYNLPKSSELIIIATGIKSEDSLEKAGAWRSLSNLVKSEDWRTLSRSEVQQRNFLRAAITIAVIVVVAFFLLIVLLHPFSPKPQVAPSPSQGTIQIKPKVEVNPEQMEQNSSIRDLTFLAKGLQSLERDSIP